MTVKIDCEEVSIIGFVDAYDFEPSNAPSELLWVLNEIAQTLAKLDGFLLVANKKLGSLPLSDQTSDGTAKTTVEGFLKMEPSTSLELAHENHRLRKMPFLEYHRLIKSNYKAIRTSRGYGALDTWQRLEEIVQAGKRLRVHDPKLAKPVLSAGRCPGLWRVYYAATKDVQTDSILTEIEYLKIRVPAGMTRRHLGKLFEKWVTAANQAYNSFLETEKLESLDHLPGTIGEHYRERAGQHSRESSSGDFKLSRMTLGHLQVSSSLSIYDLDPDGIFCEGPPGAVFESKLSVPSYFEFDTEMAIYALALEKVHQRDIDFAITLYSDYPRGLQVLTHVRRIFDSHVDEITTNLEKSYRLIQSSEAAHKQSRTSQVGPSFRSLTHLGYGSWKSFLVRPDGLPESSNRGYCETCKYRKDCFNDGGET